MRVCPHQRTPVGRSWAPRLCGSRSGCPCSRRPASIHRRRVASPMRLQSTRWRGPYTMAEMANPVLPIPSSSVRRLRRSVGCPPDEAASFSPLNLPCQEGRAGDIQAHPAVRSAPIVHSRATSNLFAQMCSDNIVCNRLLIEAVKLASPIHRAHRQM